MSESDAASALSADIEISDVLQRYRKAGFDSAPYFQKAVALAPDHSTTDALISAALRLLKSELRKLLRKPSKYGLIRFLQRALGYLPEETQS